MKKLLDNSSQNSEQAVDNFIAALGIKKDKGDEAESINNFFNELEERSHSLNGMDGPDKLKFVEDMNKVLSALVESFGEEILELAPEEEDDEEDFDDDEDDYDDDEFDDEEDYEDEDYDDEDFDDEDEDEEDFDDEESQACAHGCRH